MHGAHLKVALREHEIPAPQDHYTRDMGNTRRSKRVNHWPAMDQDELKCLGCSPAPPYCRFPSGGLHASLRLSVGERNSGEKR